MGGFWGWSGGGGILGRWRESGKVDDSGGGRVTGESCGVARGVRGGRWSSKKMTRGGGR